MMCFFFVCRVLPTCSPVHASRLQTPLLRAAGKSDFRHTFPVVNVLLPYYGMRLRLKTLRASCVCILHGASSSEPDAVMLFLNNRSVQKRVKARQCNQWFIVFFLLQDYFLLERSSNAALELFNLCNRYIFSLLGTYPELRMCLNGKEWPYFYCLSNLINPSHLFSNWNIQISFFSLEVENGSAEHPCLFLQSLSG